MPEPKAGESEDKFVERCIPVVLDDGTAEDGAQAAAICHSMWRKAQGGKAMLEGEPVIAFGGAIKALGDGKVGGLLVRFTTENDPDLVGDFFTADTDFGEADSSAVYYQHGLDDKLGHKRIGKATLRQDEFGVWAEAQLKMRDEYERFVYEMAEAGKLGWSSGTAQHLVSTRPTGKANHITSWPLGLDASLTPVPAEPRNTVIPLKMYLSELQKQTPQPEGEPQGAGEARGSDGGGADATKSTSVKSKETAMEEEKQTPQPVAPTVDIDAIVRETAKKAADEAVKAYRESLPEVDKSGHDVKVTEDGADRALAGNPYKGLGEFLMAVKAAGTGGQIEPRLMPLKDDLEGFNLTAALGSNFTKSLYGASKSIKQTGLNEGVGAQGGFLVDTDRVGGLMERVYSIGDLIQRAAMFQVSANSNGMTFRFENETSRATGSRRGGVRGYWLAEGGTKTASQPEFREVELRLHKVAALVYATDELLQDARALESYIMRVLPEELKFLVEDSIINGTGVGMPLGILPGPSLVTVGAEVGQAATTFIAENAINMWSRLWSPSKRNAVWLINPDVGPQLNMMGLGVGTGGQLVYMPPGGLSQAPYGTLMGRPVLENEYCPTLGTLGDVILADLSQYYMIEKGGVQAASSIHVNFVYDETVFRFVYRVDGLPSWNSALTPFQGTNTVSPFVVLEAR